MAYNAFDGSKPVISDTRGVVVSETNENVRALRDMVIHGADGSLAWTWSITGGTNDVPTTIVLTNGTQRQRWTLTWAANTRITSITGAYSSDSGALYDTIGSWTFGFTGDDVSSGNVGSFILGMLVKCISEARDAYGLGNTHYGLSGTSVHGLGTMSTQNSAAVVITGGSIDAVGIGTITPTMINGTRVSEVHTAVAFGGASTNLNHALGSSFSFTATSTGAAALTFTNPPPTNRLTTILLALTNGGLRTWTWPTGTKWAGAAAPALTSAGLDLLSFTTYDGGTNWHGTLVSKASA